MIHLTLYILGHLVSGSKILLDKRFLKFMGFPDCAFSGGILDSNGYMMILIHTTIQGIPTIPIADEAVVSNHW